MYSPSTGQYIDVPQWLRSKFISECAIANIIYMYIPSVYQTILYCICVFWVSISTYAEMVTLVLAYDPVYTVLSNRFTLPDYSTEYPEVGMVHCTMVLYHWYSTCCILLTVPGTEYPEVASIGTWPSYSIAIIPDWALAHVQPSSYQDTLQCHTHQLPVKGLWAYLGLSARAG